MNQTEKCPNGEEQTKKEQCPDCGSEDIVWASNWSDNRLMCNVCSFAGKPDEFIVEN